MNNVESQNPNDILSAFYGGVEGFKAANEPNTNKLSEAAKTANAVALGVARQTKTREIELHRQRSVAEARKAREEKRSGSKNTKDKS